MTSRTDNALNQFLAEHFAAQRAERQPKPIEPMTAPDIFKQMIDFLERSRAQVTEITVINQIDLRPGALNRVYTKLPRADWRNLR